MPAQKRLYENTDEDLPENNHENHQEQQQQQGEESDRSASSSSGRDQDEFILVRLPDIRKEVQCPICLGIIKKTRTVMECLHRFCRECIDKSMRMGNNECPACRTHCASRRSLRDDPNYDALIAALYPDIDQYEEEELAFHEEEKARNNQIQALIAQTFQRQSEALSKKRRRSQGILRRRRNYRSDDDDDANANDAGKDSSSADERCTEVKPKRSKRWRGQSSSAAGIGDGACDENDSELNRESGVASGGLVGSNSEMLAWGKGGMRSHTRYGSGSGGNGKHARNSRLAKLVEHLRNLDDNDDELDIHLVLVSLDEQKIPGLQQPYLCCKSAISIKQLCDFISLQTTLQAEDVEILALKEWQFELASSASLVVQLSTSTALDACKDNMQLLDLQETLGNVKTTCNSSQGYLILAYRQKVLKQES
ncbi:hypothetical protein Nepgr_017669 [Nepenthes gracilis]|uniref:RING-type domain-containing protein n=1 Tax=Nepenthes gracilis TaxID=150966 RepID=A0AAD3SPS6_NEPGR|nr:hypothetical protein Nepgr_017669 [Nepenthes gracilis]